jgi:GntR family transcriptional regulator / MocR family aminotransferase
VEEPVCMELMIPIRRDAPLGRQVFAGLRSAIASGAVKAGQRLPSTRDLADQLKVSRTVVLGAYDQLIAEGYAEGRRGAGTFAASGLFPTQAQRGADAITLSAYGSRVAAVGSGVDLPPKALRPPRFDFAYGRGEITDFPFEQWRRLLMKHARNISRSALDYAPAAGEDALREAIAVHVRRSRGVVCEASQVIVVNGAQQALDLVIRVLIDPGDKIAIENPHYQGTRIALSTSAATLIPVPVDEDGLDPSKLPADARAVFVTPSHQFPTGVLLSLQRRIALLAWASEVGAFVVEDDYDGEFRHDGQPLESLQGLDRHGRVIYVGTFSRTMFAALRLGYLVVPSGLVDVFSHAKWLADRHTATLEQRTLAEFIGGGGYDRYLRRLRRSLRARRDALIGAIAETWQGRMHVTGAASGAHVMLWPTQEFDEKGAIEAARANQVGVYGASGYYVVNPKPGLVLGYSQLSEADIAEGIRRLGTTFALA